MSLLVAVCFHHFGPYHIARIAAASQRMRVVGVEFSGSPDEYPWTRVDSGVELNREVVVAGADIRSLPAGEQARRVWSSMDRLQADVVAVNGWSMPSTLAVFHWASMKRVPVVVMSESTEHDATRTFIKEAVKRRVVARAQAALVGGSAHVAYARKLGIPESRIFKGYDVVDNDYFARETDKRRTGTRPDSVPVRPYFLASSRFVPKKNLQRMLNAFDQYRRAAGDRAWELVLLGDGELGRSLRQQRAQLGLDAAVHMPGFVQYPELPDFYAWAEVFIHASTTEQWGLVVNEAMASGLPVLVSDRCGCAPDLVIPGRNGEVFDPYDEDSISALMLEMSSGRRDLREMGASGQEIIARWTPDTFADGLQQAVEIACRMQPRRLSSLDNALLWSLTRL